MRRTATPGAPARAVADPIRVPLLARRLITSQGALWDKPWQEHGDLQGAIVRVRPLFGHARDVDQVKAEILRRGAVACRVLPTLKEAALVEERDEPAADATARQVVEEMAEQAVTDHRDLLRQAVQQAMGKAGM